MGQNPRDKRYQNFLFSDEIFNVIAQLAQGFEDATTIASRFKPQKASQTIYDQLKALVREGLVCKGERTQSQQYKLNKEKLLSITKQIWIENIKEEKASSSVIFNEEDKRIIDEIYILIDKVFAEQEFMNFLISTLIRCDQSAPPYLVALETIRGYHDFATKLQYEFIPKMLNEFEAAHANPYYKTMNHKKLYNTLKKLNKNMDVFCAEYNPASEFFYEITYSEKIKQEKPTP